MNKKGFTLIELLSVIVLIGLILGIATTGVIRGQKKAKERTLATKVKNIEKAAILYGQNHRENFVDVNDGDSETEKSLCFQTNDDGTNLLIPNCKYYNKVIKVNNFLESSDNYPEYSFICDVKTGKVYKYINNKNNEYIFNYYEEIGSTCPCCGSVLTSRTCDYCGTLTKDKLDVRVVAIALKQYGYKTEYEE